jgi:hypothetical protein
MEAGGPETEEVTWSDGDDSKCRARLDWFGGQYQKPDTGGQSDMVMTRCKCYDPFLKLSPVPKT